MPGSMWGKRTAPTVIRRLAPSFNFFGMASECTSCDLPSSEKMLWEPEIRGVTRVRLSQKGERAGKLKEGKRNLR